MTSINDARHTHQQFLMDLEIQYSNKKLSSAELTALCLIPDLVKNGINFQRSPLKQAQSNSVIIEFLRVYGWKGKTDRIRRALVRWHLEEYPLVLWDKIPSPLQLLKIQASGQRVITVFKNAADWEKTHLGKSAWEFVIHDLIHADHFFRNDQWRAGQIAFYQFILNQWDNELMVSARTYCSEQFDYLISDMNSHPQHLYKTLSALCLMAWKRKNQTDLKTRLSHEAEELFQIKLNHLLAACLLK